MDMSDPTGPTSAIVQLAQGAELSDALHDQIVALSERGDALAAADHFAEARRAYEEALALLPSPQMQWSAWTWLQGAIGDSHWFEADWPACREAFRKAVAGPDGLGNPFIHMRLGQCALELGDEARAKDELMRAYMGAGKEIFEDEDPKYLEFLATHAQLD